MPKARTLTGSHLIVKALQMEGVSNVFTLAGDHVLPLVDALADSGIRLIDTRHEQAAVHMAEAWGRITGRPGVAVYTTPGFANAVPGLASAMHGESPVLSISGSAELPDLGRGAMQEIDQIGMARPTTKGAWMVTEARRIPDMIAHALRVAYSGRRGPVHLTVPVDVQQHEVREDQVSFYPPARSRVAAGGASDGQVRAAVDLLRAAVRPLIIAGSAAAYDESGDALRRLVQTTRIPLMTEGDARGLVSDEHPYCFGFYDQGLNRAARLLGRADAVLVLGRKQDLILGYAQPPTIHAEATIVQVDPSGHEIGRNRGVDVGIVGDVETVVGQLADEASNHQWSDLSWLEELQAQRDAQARDLDALALDESPMHAMRVHKALGELLDPDDFLVFDGGDFCHFARAHLPAARPRSWLWLSPLGMLGSAVPTAMAAKLAFPGRRVVMLTGDGAFGFNAMEYDTAVRHDLPFVGILGNDAAWGIDRQIQLGVFGRPVATDLIPTRYDRVVAGLGGHGELVERPEELTPAIRRAFGQGRPALINVLVQRAISPRAEIAITRWRGNTAQPI